MVIPNPIKLAVKIQTTATIRLFLQCKEKYKENLEDGLYTSMLQCFPEKEKQRLMMKV